MTDPADPRKTGVPLTDEQRSDDGAQAQPEQEPPAAPDASAQDPAAGKAADDAGHEPGDEAGQDLTADEAGPDISAAEAFASALAELSTALEAVTRERDTYLDHLRRERAQFENYRKRSTRELTEASDRGAEALISQMLSVLDNFGYVLEAAKDHDDAVAKGVRMVHAELRDVLARAGLEDVPGVGAPFDPTWHDAVMQVEGETTEEGEPVVAQVLRNGYRFKGRVLRPASVAVTQ
jgi:molecular chaperone GrpE